LFLLKHLCDLLLLALIAWNAEDFPQLIARNAMEAEGLLARKVVLI
jgi:hypothetical protein